MQVYLFPVGACYISNLRKDSDYFTSSHIFMSVARSQANILCLIYVGGKEGKTKIPIILNTDLWKTNRQYALFTENSLKRSVEVI